MTRDNLIQLFSGIDLSRIGCDDEGKNGCDFRLAMFYPAGSVQPECFWSPYMPPEEGRVYVGVFRDQEPAATPEFRVLVRHEGSRSNFRFSVPVTTKHLMEIVFSRPQLQGWIHEEITDACRFAVKGLVSESSTETPEYK
jgi:hypothetical protein